MVVRAQTEGRTMNPFTVSRKRSLCFWWISTFNFYRFSDKNVVLGYGGDEVKRGYKNGGKKQPLIINELVVRKLRLKRQAQVFTGHPATISSAARIDCLLLNILI